MTTPETPSTPDVIPNNDGIDDAIAYLESDEFQASQAEEESQEAPEPEVAPEESADSEQEAAPLSRAEEIRQVAAQRAKERAERDAARQPPPLPHDVMQKLATLEAGQAQAKQAMDFMQQFRTNPMEAIRSSGIDPTTVYEQLTRESLAPGTTQATTEAQKAYEAAQAAKQEAEQLRQQFISYQQQQQFEAQAAQVRQAWETSSASEELAHLSKLPPDVRMRYGVRAEQDFESKFGYKPPMEELLILTDELVEHEARLLGVVQAGPGGAAEAGSKQSKGGTAKKPSKTLTNDLASQTATPATKDDSPEAAYDEAVRMLERLQASAQAN